MSIHKPVLAEKMIEYLVINQDGVYLDATLGDGGHAELICRTLSLNGKLIGLDQDEDALARAKERLKAYQDRTVFIKGNFSEMQDLLQEKGITQLDGVLMDLGVSSYQVETPHRGFSFHHQGPLDMRMDKELEQTAAHLVNNYAKRDLARIFKEYGEEKFAGRIASFIVEKRKIHPFQTTTDLVEVIKDAVPAAGRRKGGHPARRVFQALRLAVNQELENLQEALPQGVELLREGGRIGVISYHSLEDRRVKQIFKQRSRCTCPPELPLCRCVEDLKLLTPKPLYPEDEEISSNPRSRSARLRVAQKTRKTEREGGYYEGGKKL